MAKKKTANPPTKASAKAAKKAKAAQKVERKEKKKASKSKDDLEDDDQDLEAILAKMQRDWEDAHKVTEELVEGPPSRRANATLTACPNGNHLWCIGGEFFDDDGKAHFYNDVFRYSPEKDEWRKFVSQTCPGPRSAHAVVASAAGGGKLFLFGGEFSSLHQTTFHHYRDFWCFDIATHTWDRIDTKVRPTARSGHRMAMWRHYIVLFGGFYDPGLKTNYLNDLWIFDTQEYHWKLIEFKEHERRPSVRSGFSFLSTPEGILLHGGYCKEYPKGSRPIGVMLEDTWFLKMSMPEAVEGKAPSKGGDLPIMKWERRKRPSTAYAPSLRSGCTMTLWAAKSMGILFGGVTDEDTNEETLDSVFHNDLYGYNITGNGRWVSLTLKKPKMKGKIKPKATKNSEAPTKPVASPKPAKAIESDAEDGGSSDDDDNDDDKPWIRAKYPRAPSSPVPSLVASRPKSNTDIEPDDPNLTTPLPRYNAMLSVLRNTLYIYGGIFERGSREYTLDDFYSLQLDKLDRYVCLKASEIDILNAKDESSSEDDDDDDDDDSEDSDEDNGPSTPRTPAYTVTHDDDISDSEKPLAKVDEVDEVEVIGEDQHEDSLRARAAAFMGVAKDTTRSAEDVTSTPLPGETVAMFYARSREYWAQKAHQWSDNKGKMLRKVGFDLAKERYDEYEPILKEVEKILAEAGLDEEEMRKSAAAGPGSMAGQSRNRR